MITLTQYRDKFDEHASVPNAQIEECIGYANSDVSAEYLGHMHERAQLYYAAHYVQSDYANLITSDDGSVIIDMDSVKKLKMDKLEVEFKDTSSASGSGDDSIFETTSYGRKYLELVRTMIGPVSL